MDVNHANTAQEARELHAVGISAPHLWIKDDKGERIVSKLWLKLWPFKSADIEVLGPAVERRELLAMLAYFHANVDSGAEISKLVSLLIEYRRNAETGAAAHA